MAIFQFANCKRLPEGNLCIQLGMLHSSDWSIGSRQPNMCDHKGMSYGYRSSVTSGNLLHFAIENDHRKFVDLPSYKMGMFQFAT